MAEISSGMYRVTQACVAIVLWAWQRRDSEGLRDEERSVRWVAPEHHMVFGFNARKAAQVVAYLASKTPNKRLNVVKAVKLVYLADRESLARHGFPIIDDDRVSMPLGPVNSTTYRYVKSERESDDWSCFLKKRIDHEIALEDGVSEEDLDELSDADIACLDAVFERFGSMHWKKIVEWAHNQNNIPEWRDPNGSSAIIPVRRILDALGVENANEQANAIEDHRAIDRLFASIR
jgi:uncharacterized phage-associated protein